MKQGNSGLKIAIVGSSGYIAGYIQKRLNPILRLDYQGEYDTYLNLEQIEKFDFNLLNDIDFIIFTAAISGPDKCAQDFDYCWNINVKGTSQFIHEALTRSCKVLFFSSDAVFGNIPGAIYTEKSNTEAVTPYGKMKKAVEDEFLGNPLFKAIRLSYVASTNDRFIKYCVNCINNNEIAEVFHPFYRNVIVVSDVVDVVAYFAMHWEEYEPTFLNVAGKELVSRIRIVDELNRYFIGKNLHNKILQYKVSIPDEVFFTNRPRITQMKSLYMRQYNILPDNTFTEKIQKELEQLRL